MEESKYIGMNFTSNKGEVFSIIKYDSSYKVTIEFKSNGYRKVITLSQARAGSVRNTLKVETDKIDKKYESQRVNKEKSIVRALVKDYEKNYINTIKENIEIPPIEYDKDEYPMYYSRWRGLFDRCHGKNRLKLKNISYRSCSICKEWHNFQNFAKWCNDNNLCNGMCVDKDILIKGNKIYSPDTCIVIPDEINSRTNYNTPIRKSLMGTEKIALKNGYKYIAKFQRDGKKIESKRFETELEAHKFWATSKKQHLMDVTEPFRYAMTDKAYKAVCDFSFLQI